MSAPHDPLALARAVDSHASEAEMGSPHQTAPAGEPAGDSGLSSAVRTRESFQTSSTSGISAPKLMHTRTAPTTVPVNPVAIAPGTDRLGSVRESVENGRSDDERSSAGTLGDDSGVPLVAGGLHGRPFPGSKMDEKLDGHLERDHHAAHAGPPGGRVLADKAKAELGLVTEKPSPLAGIQTHPGHKYERTASGTQVSRRAVDHRGQATAAAYGMVPLSPQISRPPIVGLFGGVAPSGEDAAMGLVAVRSREEEEERQAEMKRKGPDPFAVRFEPGDPTNPKVSHLHAFSRGFFR